MTRTLLAFALGLLLATTLVAQTAATAPAHPAAPAAASATADSTEPGMTSEELRREFTQILDHYPPEVGKVLKLDPTLMSNANYLATYPEIQQFIAQHPDVAHSPRFFLESVGGSFEAPIETAGMRMWRSVFEGLSVFVIVAFIAFVLSWIIRTIIDHRRWNRLSKLQAEVHGKLLDRFTSNEELFAYIQTPAGARFLESAPIQLDSPRQISAPLGRILWSVQSGLVLAAAGIGFQLISSRVDKDIAQPMVAIGILAIAVGLGFVISAVVSFVLSRQLGLIPGHETE